MKNAILLFFCFLYLYFSSNTLSKNFRLPLFSRKLSFSIALLLFICNSAFATTYYSKNSSLDADSYTTWTTNSDGTGINPSSFSIAEDVFIIQATHTLSVSKNSIWTVGKGVTLQIDGLLQVDGNNAGVIIDGIVALNNATSNSIVLAGNGSGNTLTLSNTSEIKTKNVYGIQGAYGALPFSGLKKTVMINSIKFDFNGIVAQSTLGLPSSSSTILKINNPAGVKLDVSVSVGSITLGDVVAGSKFTLTTGKTLSVENTIKVLPGSIFTVESEANLIQVNDNAPVNSGNITVLRDLKIGNGRTQYNYLGTPVAFTAGQSFKTIYPGISYALYHNEANNLFYTSSGANVPGRGLAVKEPTLSAVPTGTTKVTAQFTGIPQNGVISYPLANSNTGSGTTLGYNLLGNPYPSNIDLISLYLLNVGSLISPNISATFYFWDNEVNNDIALAQQGSNYSGQAYAIFNSLAGSLGTGVYAAGSLSSKVIGNKLPTTIVKAGQGFMVKALAKNYTMKFNNSVRASASSLTDFLGKPTNMAIEDDRYWLKLTAPSGLTSSLAVVYFERGKNSCGEEDSESKGGSDAVYTISDGKKLAINGRAPFTVSDVVSLGMQHFVAGTYTITIDQVEGVFLGGQNIYLKDLQTGAVTNISKESYTFHAEAGESIGRFVLKYQEESVLSTQNQIKEDFLVYRNGNDFHLKSPSKMTHIELFDMTGKLIYTSQPNLKEAVVNADGLQNGVYVFKITQNGLVTVKKVLK